ncbi:MAG: ROK family transcriptional regulator [Acidobacteriota bacterium]|nr:ROK family transcriptional regulator [Acidobacteriota bacterium]
MTKITLSTSPPLPRTMPSRPSQLRQTNARGLLRLLQEHNPCSKADLVRSSGLSAPTVSSAISHLDELGLIEQVGDGESSGGRPPGLLRFNVRHGYVAAADIGGTRMRMMLADLGGTVIGQSSTLLNARQKTPEGMSSLIVEGLKALCRQSCTPWKKVLHLTAGAPGITDVHTGVVLSAPNLHRWDDVPFRSLLEAEAGIACAVENDTNLAAVGESWRGAARGVDDFVFIALGTGVGAGIFINGRLHRGARWSAGEIGYLGVTGRRRAPMKVRELGQLEQAIGGSGIEQEWRRQLKRTDARCGTSRIDGLEGLKASEIFDLAADGDRMAGEVLRYTSTILADAIADISLLLNPQVVVLGGGVGSHPELCRAVEKLVQRHEFARPLLRSSGLGTQAQLHGAVSVSLRAVEEQMLG